VCVGHLVRVVVAHQEGRRRRKYAYPMTVANSKGVGPTVQIGASAKVIKAEHAQRLIDEAS